MRSFHSFEMTIKQEAHKSKFFIIRLFNINIKIFNINIKHVLSPSHIRICFFLRLYIFNMKMTICGVSFIFSARMLNDAPVMSKIRLLYEKYP